MGASFDFFFFVFAISTCAWHDYLLEGDGVDVQSTATSQGFKIYTTTKEKENWYHCITCLYVYISVCLMYLSVCLSICQIFLYVRVWCYVECRQEGVYRFNSSVYNTIGSMSLSYSLFSNLKIHQKILRSLRYLFQFNTLSRSTAYEVRLVSEFQR